jgi:hypothetical protein
LIVALVCALAGPPETTQATAEPGEEAAEAPFVLIVTANASDGAGDAAITRQRRTRAELEAAGYEVLEVGLTEPIDEVDADRIDGLAQEYEARVVAVLHPSLARVELWIADGNEIRRRAVVHGKEEGDEVFAVRVAEVLQATLIRVEAQTRKPASPPTTTKPGPDAPPPAPEPPPRWGTRLGAHAAGSTGGLGFMFGPTIGATVAVGKKRRLGIDLEGYATALPGRVVAAAGEASVGFAALRGTVGWWPLPGARVSPGVGLGWGMLVGWTRGRGAAPYAGRNDATVVSTPVGAGDLAIAVSRRFRIRLGFRIGVALPAIRVQTLTGTTRAAQPIADGGIAFELTGPGRR